MASSSSTETFSNVQGSFTCFPGLPIELRLKIWEYAIPDPRTVHLFDRHLKHQRAEYMQKYCPQEYAREKRRDAQPKEVRGEETEIGEDMVATTPSIFSKPQVLYRITSNSTIPTILLVSRESHAVASQHFKQAFCVHKPGGACTYFDYERDTAYMRVNTFSSGNRDPDGYYSRESMSEVRNLAILLRSDTVYSPMSLRKSVMYSQIMTMLVNFSKLRNLTIVANEHFKYRRERPNLVLIDMIDVQATLQAYRQYSYNPRIAQLPKAVILDTYQKDFSMLELESARSEWLAEGCHTFGMPSKVDFKIAVPKTVQEELKEWEGHARAIEKYHTGMTDQDLWHVGQVLVEEQQERGLRERS